MTGAAGEPGAAAPGSPGATAGSAPVRALLQQVESTAAGTAELGPQLAYLAGMEIVLDEIEVSAALRRAQLLLVAGGDPHRELELDGRAVSSVAADLETGPARDALAAGLERLLAEADGLPTVGASLRLLLRDGDLAWQSYACALLADDLASE